MSFFPLFDFQCITYTLVSDFVDEGTPVPIPNTVVKLIYAYNTWREAAREDWSSLTFEKPLHLQRLFYYFLRRKSVKEYLDVRDYDGNKLGFMVERGKHQHKDWWYLCIHAYIMNNEGKFLIQQRAMTKKYFPGIWDITCGAALAGETSLDAAIRETKEELGLDVSSFDISFIGTSHCSSTCLSVLQTMKVQPSMC